MTSGQSSHEMSRGRDRQPSTLGSPGPRRRSESRRLSDSWRPAKDAAQKRDRHPGTLHEGDPVSAFSRSAEDWVNAEFVCVLQNLADVLRRLGRDEEAISLQQVCESVAEEASCSKLFPGLHVRIHGLIGAPQFNGQDGTCERWDSEKLRWCVRLQDGTQEAFRSENLFRPGLTVHI